MNESPMVSISCITYNHAPYIKETIEGFLMQQTNFAFEILIHDDASTDGTEQIIRQYEARYPDIIKALYETENQWAKGRRGSKEFNYPRANGKYIALCEGDDYWTDPYKLQKQVDFLEANPEYGLVHTDLDLHIIKSGRWVRSLHKTAGDEHLLSGDLFETLLLSPRNLIFTCTVCFRASFIEEFEQLNLGNYAMGDGPQWVHIAAKHKVGYLPESTAVQNRLPFSATQGRAFEHTLDMHMSGYRIYEDFTRIRPVSGEIRKRIEQKFHVMIFDLCYRHRARPDLFEEKFRLIDPKHKTLVIRVKYFLFRHGIDFRLSRLLVKALEKLGKRELMHFDLETGRQGDKETRRQGNKVKEK